MRRGRREAISMRELLDGLSRFSICITHAYLPRGRCDLEGQVISGPGAKKGFRKYTWVLIVPVGVLPLCLSLATVLGTVGLDPAERYTRVSAALYFDLPLGAISTGIAAYGFMHRSSWSDSRLYDVFSAVPLIAVVAVAGFVFPAAWSPLGSLKNSLEDWLGGHQNASDWVYIWLATLILTGAPLVYWSFIMQRRRKTLVPRAFALSGSLVFFVGLVFARTAGAYMLCGGGMLILPGGLLWGVWGANRTVVFDGGNGQFRP